MAKLDLQQILALKQYKDNQDMLRALDNRKTEITPENKIDVHIDYNEVEKKALAFTKQLVQDFLSKIPAPKDGSDGANGKDAVITQSHLDTVSKMVLSRITLPENGKDAEITQDLIDSIVSDVLSEIDIPELPDIATALTTENEAIRDGLELLQGDERLSATAIEEKSLVQIIKDNTPKQLQQYSGGGISNTAVQNLIKKALEDFGTSETDWGYHATNVKYTDITGTIATGKVLTGTIEGNTVYRYITTAKTGLYPTEDSFYSAFDGTTLSDLIVTK